MASKFITNQDLLVSEMMGHILPSTKEMFFLVGYFYFSGFEQIYKSIGDRPLKILVGMDVERDIAGVIREYDTLSPPGVRRMSPSRANVRERFGNAFVSIVNETDHFDTEAGEAAFKFFLEKIRIGSLEIRKTIEPNHAKLYLFSHLDTHSQGGQFPGTVLTGSSNLTYSGLTDRHEVNVVLRDSNDYEDGKRIFDELWNTSVPIADAATKDRFFDTVVSRLWIEKLPRPFLIYLRVLLEYFGSRDEAVRLPSEITAEKYFNAEYQADAIRQGVSIVTKHSGCIVADVVGLGKSIIACGIAYNLGLKVVVVAPPHLLPQWEAYTFDFGLSSRVYSLGKLDQALEENEKEKDLLLIIDEAHRFRNEANMEYGLLHKLCQGNKVLLLSATPFNNRPQDIFSLIKLFQIPTKATLRTVDNLAAEMYSLIDEYKRLRREQAKTEAVKSETKERIEALALRIRDVLSPLVIRRTRVDLDAIEVYRDDLEAQGLSFPEIADPVEVDYELGELSGLYIGTLERICPESTKEGFIGARYKPLTYLVPGVESKYSETAFSEENLLRQSQVNLATFMKRLLVRRFESSTAAFRKTLDSMIASTTDIISWYERFGMIPLYKRGRLPDFDALNAIIDDDLHGLFEESLDTILAGVLTKDLAKGLVLIAKEDLMPAFIQEVRADLALLKAIRLDWEDDKVRQDPKFDAFAKMIEKSRSADPARKLVVFSEFADTVEHVAAELKKRKLRVMKYTAADASESSKNAIRANFDAGYSKDRDDYDIIVATDAISEGFNLHRAGAVYNYDIPYNPTRVIQRVGRINRVNLKVFDKLYIYNFFPTATGEYVTHTKAVSTFKIALIQAILGEDTKVLTADEETRSYFGEQYRKAAADASERSWDVDYLNTLNGTKKRSPDIIEAALKLPRRSRTHRSAGCAKSGVLLFARKGNECRFSLARSVTDIEALAPDQALPLFEAEGDEKALALSPDFAALYKAAKQSLGAATRSPRTPPQSAEASAKIRALIIKLGDEGSSAHEYLEDLSRVIDELASLPEVYLKIIRSLRITDVSAAIEELKSELPSWYIGKILSKAAAIGAEPEQVILAEELM